MAYQDWTTSRRFASFPLSLRFDPIRSTIGRSVSHGTMFPRCKRKTSMNNLLVEGAGALLVAIPSQQSCSSLPVGKFGPYHPHS